MSDTVVSHTGYGPVTLTYTSDFTYNSEFCQLQKFSEDYMMGCISEGKEVQGVVDSFVEWCGLKHLQLNTSKMK